MCERRYLVTHPILGGQPWILNAAGDYCPLDGYTLKQMTEEEYLIYKMAGTEEYIYNGAWWTLVGG